MTSDLESTATPPPLAEFLPAYRADDNIWWKMTCGHHQNLFDEACARYTQLLCDAATLVESRDQRIKELLQELRRYGAHLEDCAWLGTIGCTCGLDVLLAEPRKEEI